MLKIVSSKQFKKDLKQAYKRGFEISKLSEVVNTLALNKPLEDKYHDHQLYGRYSGF